MSPTKGIPNQTIPTASAIDISMYPRMAKGMIFPRISAGVGIGETMSCSSVPLSRSRTIAIAVRSIVIMVSSTATIPGTM